MSISIEVWGDYACFTRPEMKVERVSYDVMTPSAARGIIEAIYWHPGLKWIVDEIRVCAPIRFMSIRRNEVKDVVLGSAIKAVMNGKKTEDETFIVTKDSIQQRAALILRDVHYVIDAHFEMTEKACEADNPGKFQDIIKRRIEKGQFFHQPYFGTREFPVCFGPCKEYPDCPQELKGTRDLGWMLLDMDYSDAENINPVFFKATMTNGIIKVPRGAGR